MYAQLYEVVFHHSPLMPIEVSNNSYIFTINPDLLKQYDKLLACI